jgi:hypothetical protein
MGILRVYDIEFWLIIEVLHFAIELAFTIFTSTLRSKDDIAGSACSVTHIPLPEIMRVIASTLTNTIPRTDAKNVIRL